MMQIGNLGKYFRAKKSRMWLLASIIILLVFALAVHSLRSSNQPSRAAAMFVNNLLQGTPEQAIADLAPQTYAGLSDEEKKSRLQEFRKRILQDGKVIQITAKKAKSKDYGITVSVPVSIKLQHQTNTREQKEIIKMQYINRQWKVLL